MYFLGFCALLLVASAFSIVAMFDPFIGRAELAQTNQPSPSPTAKPSPAGSPGTGSLFPARDIVVVPEPAKVPVATTGHSAILPAHDSVASHSHFPAIVTHDPGFVTTPQPVTVTARSLMVSHTRLAPSNEIGS